MTAIRVAAPATTANLGPGYDCLGMALDIWNTVEVEPLPEGDAPSVSVSGEGAGELEAGPENLVYRSMEFLYRELGRPMPPLSGSLQQRNTAGPRAGQQRRRHCRGTGRRQRPRL